MSAQNRPISPHIQIYRWQWTMAGSILHRITGVGLAVGALLLVCWLLAVASGADAFDGLQAFIGSWFGRLLLFGWTYALFYHLCNGVRHLFWDAGYGFELDTAYGSAIGVFVGSTVMTLGAWIAGYTVLGG